MSFTASTLSKSGSGPSLLTTWPMNLTCGGFCLSPSGGSLCDGQIAETYHVEHGNGVYLTF